MKRFRFIVILVLGAQFGFTGLIQGQALIENCKEETDIPTKIRICDAVHPAGYTRCYAQVKSYDYSAINCNHWEAYQRSGIALKMSLYIPVDPNQIGGIEHPVGKYEPTNTLKNEWDGTMYDRHQIESTYFDNKIECGLSGSLQERFQDCQVKLTLNLVNDASRCIYVNQRYSFQRQLNCQYVDAYVRDGLNVQIWHVVGQDKNGKRVWYHQQSKTLVGDVSKKTGGRRNFTRLKKRR